MIEEATHIALSTELQECISPEMAHHFGIVPKKIGDGSLTFFIDKERISGRHAVIDELELILNKRVKLESIDSIRLQKALSTYYRKSDSTKSPYRPTGDDFLEDLIFEAKSLEASDIHIEVYDTSARVRLRIDGHLIEKSTIPKESYLELINQIKIKSNLDITEKRLPQDGRIEYPDFDMRVSILPTHHGEKVVMRILGRDASHLDVKHLGFNENDMQAYLEAVRQSNGIVLISGPTGSGKTTTLYATLKYLNDNKRNIVTVEDPIEYTLQGINQVQLKESIGLTFTTALKSFLRQDPDIIMLGEIRDAQTAQMAIRASLTGHLVLSTIHTNSAVGTIARLTDMGIPPFLIAETMNISVAQRLVRTLCSSCKAKVDLKQDELPAAYAKIGLESHYKAVGCDRCYHTGYKGRTAIYEMLPMKADICEAIKNDQMHQGASLTGLKLSDRAIELVTNGMTSLEEIYPILISA